MTEVARSGPDAAGRGGERGGVLGDRFNAGPRALLGADRLTDTTAPLDGLARWGPWAGSPGTS